MNEHQKDTMITPVAVTMRHLFLAGATSLILCGSASAGDKSSLGATIDGGIRVVPYSPTKRTQLVGLVGQPTTITFPGGEKVYRVTQSNKLGKDGTLTEAGWQTPDPAKIEHEPLGNNLTLWPVTPGTTIMTVTTILPVGCQSEHSDSCPQKVYPFRLVAKPDPTGMPDDPDATFNLIFKGGASVPRATARLSEPAGDAVDAPPKVHVASSRKAAQLARRQNETELAADRMRTDSFNHAQGCQYHGHGPQPSSIAPNCPLDNGIWTLMRFPGLSTKPSVYIGSCDGKNERTARAHGSGDFVVIEEIAASFCLRQGSDALEIINDAFNPVGRPNNTGTIAPSVERKVLQETERQQ